MTLIEWTVCHIQMLVLFSSFMLLLVTTVLYSHIVLCLDNRGSAWHCRLWSFIAAAELNCGISKGIGVGRCWREPFPDLSLKYEEYLTDARREQGARLKTFYCLFSNHQQTAMRTQGGCLFQRMTKVPVHVEHSGTKQLKQCTDKNGPVSLTYTHHHQTHRAETRQTACVPR